MRSYSFSASGSDVSQLHDSCSWFRLFSLSWSSVKHKQMFLKSTRRLCGFKSFLNLFFCASVFNWCWISWFNILVEISFGSIREYLCSWFEISVKIEIQCPPNCDGIDNNFLSMVEQCIPPVISGMNYEAIKSSSWLCWYDTSGMILMMYDGLFLNAFMKLVLVAWGSALAIIEQTLISVMISSV